MNQTSLYFSSQSKSFDEVLKEVQAYLSSKYATLLSNHPAEQKQQIIAYISQYLTDHRLHVAGLTLN